MASLKKNNRWNGLIFGITFLIVSVALLVELVFYEKNLSDAQRQELKNNEIRVVTLETELLGQEIQYIISDLQYLSDTYSEFLAVGMEIQLLQKNWLHFAEKRKLYDQIRFIDADGQENIRINYQQHQATIVPLKSLQNKKDRYYFYEAMALSAGEIYISPLDLNVEHGEIELPYKPMIRFSTPIYDRKGTLKGVLVLNYLASNLLENFEKIMSNSQGEVALLNQEGYWLYSEDETKEWGFMFDDRNDQSVKLKKPTLWQRMQIKQGQVMNKEGLYTFSTIPIQDKIGDDQADIYSNHYHWHILSYVEPTNDRKQLFVVGVLPFVLDVFRRNAIYFIMILLVSFLIGLVVFLRKQSYAKTKYYSEYDAMTGVLNRRAGLQRIRSELNKGHGLSLCFIDINGLKTVNDVLGHQCGDELIITVVDEMKMGIRDSDFIVRLGGDEFLLGLVNVDEVAGEVVWKRIVSRYDQINQQEDRAYNISASHGIIDYGKKELSEIEIVLKQADDKMYSEKKILKRDLNVLKSSDE